MQLKLVGGAARLVSRLDDRHPPVGRVRLAPHETLSLETVDEGCDTSGSDFEGLGEIAHTLGSLALEAVQEPQARIARRVSRRQRPRPSLEGRNE